MPDFKSEVRRLRKAKGLSQAALAEKIGVTQGQVSHLEMGRRGEGLPPTAMARLCSALGVPLDHFVPFHSPGVTVPPPPTTSPAPGSSEPKIRRPQPEPDFGRPLLGVVSAGKGANEVMEGEMFYVGRKLKGADFFVEIEGDSMKGAGIYEGDSVAVQRNESPESGERVVAWVQHLEGHVIKCLDIHEDGNIYLVPWNDEKPHPPIAYNEEDGDKMLGVFIGLVRGKSTPRTKPKGKKRK